MWVGVCGEWGVRRRGAREKERDQARYRAELYPLNLPLIASVFKPGLTS